MIGISSDNSEIIIIFPKKSKEYYETTLKDTPWIDHTFKYYECAKLQQLNNDASRINVGKIWGK